MGGVPWGIEVVNRCRSYLRYQKRKRLKISKFGLNSLIQIWAVQRWTKNGYSFEQSYINIAENIEYVMIGWGAIG